MFEIKANFKNKCDSNPFCPFRRKEDESFYHIFACESEFCKNSPRNSTLLKLSHYSYNVYLEDRSFYIDIKDI